METAARWIFFLFHFILRIWHWVWHWDIVYWWWYFSCILNASLERDSIKKVLKWFGKSDFVSVCSLVYRYILYSEAAFKLMFKIFLHIRIEHCFLIYLSNYLLYSLHTYNFHVKWINNSGKTRRIGWYFTRIFPCHFRR